MLLTRERFEQMEAERLAPYAMLSQDSRGRAYPEPEHPFRPAFQRDRDRIIHTTAFRRLEYKTQVFVYYEGDYYRTRLTHTIETAQIGRTLARTLAANEDLTEAITLAHDLGHPPFGHAGERALHQLMEGHGGFNHNAHSLRIVEKLERRYPDFRGLNLTWEVREGIVKHSTEYDRADASGYEPERAATLEAQIVNMADEVAYNTHDLDDGLRAGIIGWEEIKGLALCGETESLMAQEASDLARHQLIRHLVNTLATDVILATEAKLNELKPGAAAEVRDLGTNIVGFSPEMAAKNGELRSFLMQHLYGHHRLVEMHAEAERIVQGLFNAYLCEPQQLPAWVQDRMEGEEPARVICDYIAGMTDRFAVQQYERLCLPD